MAVPVNASGPDWLPALTLSSGSTLNRGGGSKFGEDVGVYWTKVIFVVSIDFVGIVGCLDLEPVGWD